MSNRVNFTIDAEAGKALQEFLKVNQGLDKMTAGFRKVAGESRAALSQVEKELKRLEGAAMRATASTIAGVRRRVGTGALSITASQRALARDSMLGAAPGTAAGDVQLLSMQRRMAAQQIRDGRSAARSQQRNAEALSHSLMMRGVVDSAMGDIRAERAARLGREGTSMANAASVAYLGNAARAAGETRDQVRARRYVARQIDNTPEMRGQVSPDQFDQMVQNRMQNQGPGFFSTQNRMGYAGYGMAIAGYYKMGQAVNTYFANMERATQANVSFEDSMTPLLSLGNNLANAPAYKKGILAESAARGMSTSQIIPAKFNFLSGASNLSKDTQDQIWQQAMLITNVKGGNLDENVNALVKMQQVFGSGPGGAFKSVKEMASKLAFTEAEGTITMSELATQAPDVFPAFKEAGYGYEDFAAALQVTTQRMGRNEATLTQLRNISRRLLKAQDVLGIKFKSSDLGGRLGEIKQGLAGKSNDERIEAITDIFEEQGFVVASTLLNNLGDFSTAQQRYRGAGEQFLFGRQIQRSTDPAYVAATIGKSTAAVRENLGATLSQDPEYAKKSAVWDLTMTGAEMALRKEQPWATDEDIKRQAKAEYTAFGANNRYAALASNTIYDAQLQSAGPDEASRESIMLNAYMQQILTGQAMDSDKTAMNQADADELQNMWAQGLHIGPGKLAEYHRIAAGPRGKKAADAWLAKSTKMFGTAEFEKISQPAAAPAAAQPAQDLEQAAVKAEEMAVLLRKAGANMGGGDRTLRRVQASDVGVY